MKFLRKSASVTAVNAYAKTMFLLAFINNVNFSSEIVEPMSSFLIKELNSKNSRSSESVFRNSCALVDSRINSQPTNSLQTVYVTRLTRRIVLPKKTDKSKIGRAHV